MDSLSQLLNINYQPSLDFTALADDTSFYDEEIWNQFDDTIAIDNKLFDFPTTNNLEQCLTPPPSPPDYHSCFQLNDIPRTDIDELRKFISTREHISIEAPTDLDVDDIWKYITTDYNNNSHQIDFKNKTIGLNMQFKENSKQDADKKKSSFRIKQEAKLENAKLKTVEGNSKTPTKKIKRKIRNHPNNCYHLWDFIRDGLNDTTVTYVVWVKQSVGEFRITNTAEFSQKWGCLKNSKSMTYDKLSRSLRYYCSLNVLEKVPGTRLQFRFGKRRTWTKLKN